MQSTVRLERKRRGSETSSVAGRQTMGKPCSKGFPSLGSYICRDCLFTKGFATRDSLAHFLPSILKPSDLI
jgi:hypothetical protein